MNNLQIGDKIYPSIEYNEGKIWVDKIPSAELGDIFWDKIEGIIAQSPELNLEGVIVVPVKTVEDKMEKIYKAIFKDQTHCYHFPELKQLVILAMSEVVAQSKGTYTEEQVRKAIEMSKQAIRDLDARHKWKTDNEIIQSLQPVLEVEMKEVENIPTDYPLIQLDELIPLGKLQEPLTEQIQDKFELRNYYKLKD